MIIYIIFGVNNIFLVQTYIVLLPKEHVGRLGVSWGVLGCPGVLRLTVVCACAILKDRPVCYGSSRLKSRVCAVTRCALLKTPTLKSNKR